MELLGIGPWEVVTIFIIILLILGPKDMIKTGNRIGEFIRKLVSSDNWRALKMAQKEMRTLPNKLAREAGLQEYDLNREKPLEKKDPETPTDIGSIMPELNAWIKSPIEDDEGKKGEKNISTASDKGG